MKKDITIIIPCYNEQDVLPLSISSLIDVSNKLKNIGYEVVLLFVNDGSNDRTFDILFEAAKIYSEIQVLSFSRNFGHQAAITAGVNFCRTNYAAIIDADLQDPPELIPDMLHILVKENAEIVFGQRNKRKGESLFKRLSARWFYKVLNYMSEIELPKDVGDFRVIGPNAIRQFNKFTEHGKYVRGLMSWIGYKQIAYKYVREARLSGDTKYPLRKMLRLAMSSFLYFSTKPLKFILSLGGLSVLVSIVYALYALFGKMVGFTDAVSGWTTLVILLSFFSGMQMITIGVVGLYIGGIFDEVKGRSEYILSEDKCICK